MANISSRPLRVLSIAHTAVSRSAGRLRYHPLGSDPSLDIKLIIPTRWYQFGRWFEADQGDEAGIAVTPLPIRLPRAGPAGWYLHLYPKLGQHVAEFAPDVIHLWEEPWSLVALHATILARRTGAALVLEIDQNILKRLPPPFQTIRRQVLRRTDLIMARSRQATDVARSCGYTGPAMQVGYGVDQTIFFPEPKPPPTESLHLGYVGRLIVEKGIDDVLDAVARSKLAMRVSILGEGPHEAALRERVAAAGLSERVAFLPWGGPEMVADLLRKLDVLILPTRTTDAVKEQFGRVIIESQSCGTPVIGSTCGAIPDVIGDGGWVVPEADPAAISALLVRLSREPDEIVERGAAGIANVAERFTYRGVAADLACAWHQAHAIHTARAGQIERSIARRFLARAEPS